MCLWFCTCVGDDISLTYTAPHRVSAIEGKIKPINILMLVSAVWCGGWWGDGGGACRR